MTYRQEETEPCAGRGERGAMGSGGGGCGLWRPFICFSFTIAMTMTSKTMLNENGKSEHHCLILDLRGNAFSFSSLSMILMVDLSYMIFIMLRYVLSIPTLRVFVISGC